MKSTSQMIDWEMVRHEVRNQGYSQAAFAEMLGVSRETFNGMLCGKYEHELSFSFVDRLAASLGKNVYEIFEGRPESASYYYLAIGEAKLEAKDKVLEQLANYVGPLL